MTRLARTLFIAALAGCGADPPAAAPDAATVDRPDAAPDGVAPDATALDATAPDAPVPDVPALDAPSPDLPAPPDVAPADVAAPVDVDARNIPAAAALYTADRTRFGIRDVAGALARALAAPGADNVILYVHGRGCGGGGEPNKSLTEAMPALARDYTAAPILLFWPGSDDACPLGFPESRAREAGPALAAVLGDLHRELTTPPGAAVW